MPKISFKQKKDTVSQYQKELLSRAAGLQAVLNGPIFKIYQKGQISRWQSENASETGQWPTLNAKYQTYKRKKFAGYPGGGTKMMIATGNLYAGATGQDTGKFTKIATNRKLSVNINDGALPYAKRVAVTRPFMTFNPDGDTIQQMKAIIAQYIKSGES